MNQALVFYYFGGFDELVLAALDVSAPSVSTRSLEPVEAAATRERPGRALRTIYARGPRVRSARRQSARCSREASRHRGARPAGRRADGTVDRLVEDGRRLLRLPLAAPGDPARARAGAVTFYVGANLVTRLDPEHAGIDGLLAQRRKALRGLGISSLLEQAQPVVELGDLEPQLLHLGAALRGRARASWLARRQLAASVRQRAT